MHVAGDAHKALRSISPDPQDPKASHTEDLDYVTLPNRFSSLLNILALVSYPKFCLIRGARF